MATYKEQLSKHVEGIFKGYTEPGLHICDIATGGGKSYTIGKLTESRDGSLIRSDSRKCGLTNLRIHGNKYGIKTL